MQITFEKKFPTGAFNVNIQIKNQKIRQEYESRATVTVTIMIFQVGTQSYKVVSAELRPPGAGRPQTVRLLYKLKHEKDPHFSLEALKARTFDLFLFKPPPPSQLRRLSHPHRIIFIECISHSIRLGNSFYQLKCGVCYVVALRRSQLSFINHYEYLKN